LVIVVLCGQALGIAISAVAPSIEIANVFAPLIIILLMLFGGFYINVDSIPIYFS